MDTNSSVWKHLLAGLKEEWNITINKLIEFFNYFSSIKGKFLNRTYFATLKILYA